MHNHCINLFHLLFSNGNQTFCSRRSAVYSDKDETITIHLLGGVDAYIDIPDGWPVSDFGLKLISVMGKNNNNISLDIICKINVCIYTYFSFSFFVLVFSCKTQSICFACLFRVESMPLTSKHAIVLWSLWTQLSAQFMKCNRTVSCHNPAGPNRLHLPNVHSVSHDAVFIFSYFSFYKLCLIFQMFFDLFEISIVSQHKNYMKEVEISIFFNLFSFVC